MSSGSNLLQGWISDFCAPVVVVVATEEAERICLQNGLLMHELLSCFGQLDGINSVIRVGTQIINVSDGHIRFERGTEARPKSGEHLEELLLNTFKPYDITHMPTNISEIKAAPPTSWTDVTEQSFLRSMAFSECEMISHPVLILNVVATSDQEPVVAMQELASIHHTPTVFTNGQYDNNIHRVFVLLEDATEKKRDPLSVLRGLNSYFPPAHTKLISINSFPSNAPNLQQPDMWTKHLIPKFFPNHSPSLKQPLPVNPTTKQPVLGSRLSVEDFMKLREFCIWLFTDQILPILEKRLNYLTRQVNDSRKGVKNVLKSFWRKPRDETDTIKGGVKYRYDKIESQTLLLADLSFILKDYETALSNYRLVRDDYKADKSNLHYSHALMMSAICQMVYEPNKYRDVYNTLDTVIQVMQLPHVYDSVQAHAYFSLLCSEVYTLHPSARLPLDAARILLQASTLVIKYPLMSSLLVERAASYFLQSNQVRKYILHQVIAGIKFHKIGKLLPTTHATVCNATAMLLVEKGSWNDLKSKLSKSISEDFKLMNGREGAQRSLLFLLKILYSMIQDSKEIGINSSLVDAISILNEVLSDGSWGAIRVNEGWVDCSVREILLGSLPIGPLDISEGEIGKSRTEVYSLPVPEVLMPSVTMLRPINGYFFYDEHSFDKSDQLQRQLLITALITEKEWIDNERKKIENAKTLEDTMIRAEKEAITSFEAQSKLINDHTEVLRVPQGERILVKMLFQNKLPIDVPLTKVRLEVNQNEAFDIKDVQHIINGDTTQEVILEILPKQLGKYHITNVKWNLSEYFTVIQPIKKKGILLHKSIQQRANYERTKDQTLKFEIIESNPLISLKFEGLSSEVLQGQLMKGFLLLKNDGTSDAHHIYLKLSQPSFVFYLMNNISNGEQTKFAEGKFLEFYGHSSTIVNLDGIVIRPGEEIRLEAWLRLTKLGLQKISLLASYQKEDEASEMRYSYASIQTTALPSLGLSAQVSSRVSSTHISSVVTEVTNSIIDENDGKDIIRLSSVGQFDLPDLEEHFIDIDNNSVKVVGMLLLGSALPYQSSERPSSNRERLAIASPTERVTHVWPIQVLQPLLLSELRQNHLKDSEHLDGILSVGNSWLIKLPKIELDQSLKLSNDHLQSIVEQFLIIWYTHNEFSKRIEEAKRLLILEELEASAAGPRSIQDVRRERQKLSSQGEGDDMETIALTGPNGSVKVNEGDHPLNLHHHVAFSIENIIRKERLNHSLGITTIWVCRWQDKIRWGMHHIPFVNMFSPLIPKETILTSPSLYYNNSLAYLRIAVNHAKQVYWTRDCEGTHPIVPVKVTIQSLSSHRVICLSLQGLANQFSTIKQISNQDNQVLLTRMANVGFSWVGKVRYNQIHLQPKENLVIEFFAEIHSPGVHNLNRFGVIAEFADDDESHLHVTETTWTILPGTSFFAALPDEDRARFYGNVVDRFENSALAAISHEEKDNRSLQDESPGKHQTNLQLEKEEIILPLEINPDRIPTQEEVEPVTEMIFKPNTVEAVSSQPEVVEEVVIEEVEPEPQFLSASNDVLSTSKPQSVEEVTMGELEAEVFHDVVAEPEPEIESELESQLVLEEVDDVIFEPQSEEVVLPIEPEKNLTTIVESEIEVEVDNEESNHRSESVESV